MYNNVDGDYNIRIFYDGERFASPQDLFICDIRKTNIGDCIGNYSPYYPLTIHMNGPYGGSYDINFGVCDYYYMPITPTKNNLYNNNWVRTMNQLDNQKMLIAYFHLNQTDISQLDMACKVRIDNSYWNINRIIDYEFNKNQLTKVELISIEDAMVINPL